MDIIRIFTCRRQNAWRQFAAKPEINAIAIDNPKRVGNIAIGFGDKSAAKVASRGEARTIILALKFLEAAYIEQQTGKRPLILLDDVFGELDRHRQKRLMSEFVDNQIVMTSAGD
jgi:recombinational DNA repair ATPase RecF